MLERNIDEAGTTEPLETRPDLAAHLLAKGLVDAVGLARAGAIAEETGQSLAAGLVQLGLISERALADVYATLLDLDLLEPDGYPADPVLPERLRPRFLRAARVVPLRVTGDALGLAMVDPLDAFTRAAIEAATGLAVRPAVAVPIDLDLALARLYPEIETESAKPAAAPAEEDTERLKDLASEAPVIRLVNQLIARAVETRASDIHIEPEGDRLRIRYRHDGELIESDTEPVSLAPAIVSRVKIMARLDIAERRLPQDGRIRLTVRGHEIDLRVSSLPSLHGETIALRVLDRSAVMLDYGALGLPAPVVGKFRESLALPNGIVLVTGPTGSGKTTTLYTALLSLNNTARNIVTIEDPIEYELRGITQSQVKPQVGLDFAQSLRAILRQDPDVIMVGEIRDLETVQIATRAALTGHLVLSTLHTNSAAATMTRLRDMGLEPYLIASVLRGVMAQRLVRRLCPACRREETAPPAIAAKYGLAAGAKLFAPAGCDSCRGTGYRGRMAVAEFLIPDAAMAGLLARGADEAAIAFAAREAGMTPLLASGVKAAAAGHTSLAEVLRVAEDR